MNPATHKPQTNPMILENIPIAVLNSPWCKVAAVFVAYFAPISEIVHVMLIFMAVDTFSGVWAAIKEGEKIESNKLRRTVHKFLWYTISVMVAWMMEHTFKLSWTNLASITAGFICFVELKSIFENVTRITNEPVFARILKFLRKKSTDAIDEITGNEDESPKK